TQSNPELRAEAQDIARTIGVTPDMAEQSIDVMRALAQKRRAQQQRLLDTNTAVGRALADREFARIAHDDTENLTLIERFARGFEAGQLGVERGDIGNRAFEAAVLGQQMSSQDAARLAWVNKRLERPVRGIPGNTGLYVGQLSQTLVPALAEGVAV